MSNLFTRQKRGVGLAYPLPGADTLLAIDAVNDDIQLDMARMAATAIISTESFDRDGDIVEQAGLDFENYSKNPVVFFNHQAWPLPIGKSEDENGRLTVQKLDHYTTATCYFSQNSQQAEQIYHLVADKTLRGTSIGFLVKRAVPLQGAETLGMARLTNRGRDAGYRIQAAEVTEWSWVGIGANPDAVLVHLQKGLIAGRAIDERLKLALEPYAAKMHGGLVAVPAKFELLEKRGKFDSSKHPRGGRSENRGQFSSSSGSRAAPKKKPAKEGSDSKKPPKASGSTNGPAQPASGAGKTDRHGESTDKPTVRNSGSDGRGADSGIHGGHGSGSGKPDTERYLVGMSIQQDKAPDLADVLRVQKTIQNAFDGDQSIIDSVVVPTLGQYGKFVENSFCTQWTAKKNEHNPYPHVSMFARLAKEHNQIDMFVSKVLGDDEISENARPGAEVLFHSKMKLEEMQDIFGEFTTKGIDGFTMIPAPDHKPGDDAFIGIRVQVTPEIGMRFDRDLHDRMQVRDEVFKEMAASTAKLMSIVGTLSKNKKVKSAKFMRLDTVVIGKENYDEYLGGRASQNHRNGGSGARFGQPLCDILKAAAGRVPRPEKNWNATAGYGHLLRGFHRRTIAKAKERACYKTKKEKERFVRPRDGGIRLHRSDLTNHKWFDASRPKEHLHQRFQARRFSDFRAPVARFLKAISSRPFRPVRPGVSPAWVFLKNLSRAEVAPLITVAGRPRSHRHYCIKCKKCQKRIFACRCPAQNKPVKWSTCDPCLGARMVVKSMGGTTRARINLTSLVGRPKSDRALHLALKRIHKHHADYDLTRTQALTLSIAAHAIQEQVAGHQGARWHRLSAAKKLKLIERVVNSPPEASSKQTYARVFTTIINK